MRYPLVGALVVVLATISGCVSGNGAAVPDGPKEEAFTGGGTLRGLVISEELAPIPGAMVAVNGTTPSTTDVAGQFEVRGLPIGQTLRIEVLALGFQSVARDLTIPGEEPVEVQFMLAALPIETPYTELLISTGYEICTLTLGVRVQTVNPCPIGTPQRHSKHNAADSWQYLVVETDWDTTDTFWVYVSHETGCVSGDPCWGNAIGGAPLRIDGAPNDTALAARYAMDGKKMYEGGAFEFYVAPTYAGNFREDVNNTFGPTCVTLIVTTLGPLGQQWNPNLGCGLGYGFSTGIKFTNYVSLFHFERPDNPAMYSGLPDQ